MAPLNLTARKVKCSPKRRITHSAAFRGAVRGEEYQYFTLPCR